MKDFSNILGCETAQEKRDRTRRDFLAAEAKYEAARDALDNFERAASGQVQTPEIQKRRTQLRRDRQTAIDEMTDAREAFYFANKITRPGKSTRPPEYNPRFDKHDGSWVKR